MESSTRQSVIKRKVCAWWHYAGDGSRKRHHVGLELGVSVVGSVSKQVDFLIVADEKLGKGKLDSARRLNIPLVYEEEFMAL